MTAVHCAGAWAARPLDRRWEAYLSDDSAARQLGGSNMAAAAAAVGASARGDAMDANAWACNGGKCMQMMMFPWRPSSSRSSWLRRSPCRMSEGYAKTAHSPVILITWATLAATLTALWRYHPS